MDSLVNSVSLLSHVIILQIWYRSVCVSWHRQLILWPLLWLLHFAWVVDDAKCIVVTRVCVSVCVCLSEAACLHYCTDPDVTWQSGRGCPLVVHYWADLQSVHGLRCYGNTMEICVTEPSGNPSGPPHAAHTMHACGTRRTLPSPVIKSTHLLCVPFHFVHTAGVLQRERNVLVSTC